MLKISHAEFNKLSRIFESAFDKLGFLKDNFSEDESANGIPESKYLKF